MLIRFPSRISRLFLIGFLVYVGETVCQASPGSLPLLSFRYFGRKIVVQAVTREGTHLALVIDTASQASLLLPESVPRVQINTLRRNPGGLNPAPSIVTVSPLRLGAVNLAAVTFHVQTLRRIAELNQQSPLAHVDGVLGIDALQGLAIGLDLVHQKAALWQGGSVSVRAVADFDTLCLTGNMTTSVADSRSQSTNWPVAANPAYQAPHPFAIPMHRSGATGFFSVAADLDKRHMQLILDTGSEILSLPSGLAKKVTPVLALDDVAMANMDTKVPGRMLIARHLRIGEYEEQYPKIFCRIERSDDPTDALLGLADFANCRLIIDFPARKLYVSKAEDLHEDYEVALHTLGIFLFDANNHLVTRVVPRSIAEHAGLADGETITAINGFALDKPLPTEQTDPFIVKSGTEFTITAVRTLPVGYVTHPVQLGTYYTNEDLERLHLMGKQVIRLSKQGFLVIGAG